MSNSVVQVNKLVRGCSIIMFSTNALGKKGALDEYIIKNYIVMLQTYDSIELIKIFFFIVLDQGIFIVYGSSAI